MTRLNGNPTRPGRLTSGIVLVLAATACRPAPPADDREPTASPAETTEPVDLTLKAIMQGLEANMAAGAHGLWVEDGDAVGMAAGRIADHARVTPEQMSIIQTTLGEEFAAFAGHDQAVHGSAVALAETAASGTTDLLPGFSRIQEGCVACHSAFRARVSGALSAPGR